MESQKQSVLIIDDDSVYSDVIGDKLRSVGLECVYAQSGRAALELLKTLTPAVILLDMVMPNMHGIEILEALKKDPKTKPIPVIVFSNYENDKDIRRCRELGAVKYLVKVNISPADLIRDIRAFAVHSAK